MYSNRLDNNHVMVRGTLTGEVFKSHSYEKEYFYSAYLLVERRSRVQDKLLIMIPENLMNREWRKEGLLVEIRGQYRSHNQVTGGRLRVDLGIFVREYRFLENSPYFTHENNVYLDGYLCRKPNYRITPSGKEIADLMLAVNREYRKTDYVPCICWGQNARKMKMKNDGDHIRITGRIQSRVYYKRGVDGKACRFTTYEVSISNLELG